MNFLNGIAQGLETQNLKIIPLQESENVPKVEFHGKKFSDTITNLELFCLYSPSNSIVWKAITASRHSIPFDKERYLGSIEYEAFNKAFAELNAMASKTLNDLVFLRNSIEVKESEEPVHKTRKYVLSVDFIGVRLPVNQERVTQAIVHLAEYIQKAVTATNRVGELYQEKVKSLKEKLMQA